MTATRSSRAWRGVGNPWALLAITATWPAAMFTVPFLVRADWSSGLPGHYLTGVVACAPVWFIAIIVSFSANMRRLATQDPSSRGDWIVDPVSSRWLPLMVSLVLPAGIVMLAALAMLWKGWTVVESAFTAIIALLPIWLPMTLVAISLRASDRHWWHRHSMLARGICPKCRYDLSGGEIEGGRLGCPECGSRWELGDA